MRNFHKNEIDYLRENRNKYLIDGFFLSGRTQQAVRRKASLLGLTKKLITRFKNLNYFKRVDGDQPYWGGFIASDGSVSKRKGSSLRIKLAIKHISHLEKFKKEVGIETFIGAVV